MGNSIRKIHGPRGMSRRRALELAFGLTLGASSFTRLAPAQPRPELCPLDIGTHNMMVVGVRSVFLSHLPMFVGRCADGVHFETEHRFQVILEAAFQETRTKRDITEIYKQDRLQHPETRMYSLSPRNEFALFEIFSPAHADVSRRSFRAQVFGSYSWSHLRPNTAERILFAGPEYLRVPRRAVERGIEAAI